MILNVYSIFDTKARVYNQPFYQLNDDVAFRTASQLRNDTSLPFYRNPEDYILFFLGTFDDHSGLVSAVQPVAKFRFHEIQLSLPFSN